MCEKLRAVRTRDKTVEAGIGIDPNVREADYYVMSHSALNTFSKEEAEHQEKVTNGLIKILYKRMMPLRNINDVIEEHWEHFNKQAPSFVSLDAEGWSLPILKAIDYKRFRPKVICIETLVSGTTRTIPEIPEFMRAQGYVNRGGSFVNTIFADGDILWPSALPFTVPGLGRF